MGDKHQHNTQNHGGIYPVELCRSGTCNPIRLDISSTCQLGHGRRIRGSGKNILRNFFASYFVQKDERPLPHFRISKYNAGQEIRNGTPEPSDVSTVELLKISEGECGTGLGCDVRRGIIQCQLPMDCK